MNGYQGRRWDTPVTDDMPVINMAGMACGACEEPITECDDAMLLGSPFHTECHLRGVLGDVAHLEKRCSCFGGADLGTGESLRESGRLTIDWVIANRQGRWVQA